MNTSTLQEIQERVNLIDLNPIIFTLVEREDGEKWSYEKALDVEKQYRNFLTLIALYPELEIVPTKDIDTFWHTHILDTQKYMQDCENTFGYFVHHFPYFGLRGKLDEKKAEKAFSETKRLYEKHFGYSIFGSARCSSHCKQACGKKQSFTEVRPTIQIQQNY